MNRVVILAGGRGSRLGELGDTIPKPMIRIGNIPIIEHIMRKFMLDIGKCEFIVASGYRADVLQEYFDGRSNVKVVYTGNETQSAGRLKRLSYMLDNPFYFCYGDGLTDFNLESLNTHKGKMGMLAVNPIGRFGELLFDGDYKVTSFAEKPISDKWINGGFFHASPNILSYIHSDDDDVAQNMLPSLVKDGELFCIPHNGYWHCMDTPRDYAELNLQYESGKAKWLR